MHKSLTVLLSAIAFAGPLHAEEPAKQIVFSEIRLIPAGFQKAITEKGDWKNIHSYRYKISELHFYNGDTKIPNGRESLTSSRVAHVLYDTMSDCDLTTATDWKKLTYPAAVHGAFQDYGHRMKYIIPQKATHAIIATPNANSLKNLHLTLFQGETNYVDFDLSILPAAGKSTVYKLDLLSHEVTLLNSLPSDLTPHKSIDPLKQVDGTFYTFKRKSELKKINATAGSNCSWIFEDGMARLDWDPNVSKKTGSIVGSMRLPWSLAPGQTFAIDIDAGYDTWLSETTLEIKLGASRFKIQKNRDIFMPDGSQYIAATSCGVGAIQYQLFLTRGEGNNQNTIDWAITGRGYNRAGQTELLRGDGQSLSLPIKLNITRKWGWIWYNLPEPDVWDGPFINELSIQSVGVGVMEKEFQGLEEAHFFPTPNVAINDHRAVDRELASMGLPTLAPYPLENEEATNSRITAAELKTIKPWLKALPLPKSNMSLKLEWGEHDISQKILQLLNASDDLDLLDILLLRAEATMEWRNDSDKYRISFLSDRLPEGKVLPYTWPSRAGRVYKNGITHQVAETWDYSSWIMYMFVTDYIAQHPELYNQDVRVGKDAGKLNYLQKANQLIDEAFLSIEQLIMMWSDPETYAFDRPWNRYTTNLLAFHHLHSTYTALQKNNIAIDPTRAANAQKAVDSFLTSFFDPAHFEVYQEKVDGKQMDFISFRYAASPIAPYEDKQHGGAEIAVLKTLYQSGLYPELFKERYVDLVGSTIKHRLYKGMDKATGKEIFAATFAREPAMEHAGTRDGLPVNYLWTLKNDPECYDQFEKMYHKGAANNWHTYVDALILRMDRQNFISE